MRLHQAFPLFALLLRVLQTHADKRYQGNILVILVLLGCEYLLVTSVAAHIPCAQVSYMAVSTLLWLGSLSVFPAQTRSRVPELPAFTYHVYLGVLRSLTV